MARMTLWMRAVGVLYLFLFVAAALLRLPILAEGPPGIVEGAAAGEPAARFLIDTWVMIGLFFLVIGSSLILTSGKPQGAGALVLTVIGGEVVWGLGIDVYKLAHGIVPPLTPIIWIIVHAVIIATGLAAFRKVRNATAA